MSDLPNIYRSLLNSRNLAADDVLLEGLQDLEPEYQSHAMQVLLQRRRPHAMTQVIESYDRLPERARYTLEANVSLLETALRETLQSTDDGTRINIIDIIFHSRAYNMCYLLSSLLRSTSAHIRGRAANTLRDLAWHYLRLPSVASPGTSRALRKAYQQLADHLGQQPFLISALVDALQSYETHFRTTALDAILSMSLHLEEELQVEARQPQGKCWKAIVDKLQTEPHPALAAFALQALGWAGTRVEIARLISGCRDAPFMIAVCQQSWLLGDAGIREGCKMIHHLDWLQQDQATMLKFSAAQFRQALRLVAATQVDAETRVQWCRTVLLSERRDLHGLALAEVMSIQTEAALELLRIMVDWADPGLAEIARRHLERQCPDEPSARRKAPTSERRAARSAMADKPEVTDFLSYWRAFDELDDHSRAAQGQHVLQQCPDTVHRIRTELTSPQTQNRFRAIQIIRCLQLARSFAEELIVCTRDENRMVRSSAVKAAGQLGVEIAERILLMATDDRDSRVRANAIEALDDLKSIQLAEKLAPKLEDPDHRVRAAAIQVLLKLKLREAAQALLESLRDPSQAHRISALWIVEKLNLFDISPRIETLADNDPDELVRRRARRLLRQAKRHRRTQALSVPPPSTEKQA